MTDARTTYTYTAVATTQLEDGEEATRCDAADPAEPDTTVATSAPPSAKSSPSWPLLGRILLLCTPLLLLIVLTAAAFRVNVIDVPLSLRSLLLLPPRPIPRSAGVFMLNPARDVEHGVAHQPYAMGYITVAPSLDTYRRVLHMSWQLHRMEAPYDVFLLLDQESANATEALVRASLAEMANLTQTPSELLLPPNLFFLHVDAPVSVKAGFLNINRPFFGSDRAAGHDKILYAFAQMYPHYLFTWLVEEDVFIPSAHTVVALHSEAIDVGVAHNQSIADVVIPTFYNGVLNQRPAEGQDYEWHWRSVIPLTADVWPSDFRLFTGMVCMIGVSRRMLDAIDEWARTQGQLFFLEVFFASLGAFKHFVVFSSPKMERIYYRSEHTLDDFKRLPLNVFHPVKNQTEQWLAYAELNQAEDNATQTYAGPTITALRRREVTAE